ncbi:MAG: outer membrane lipoprotein carrier protein LolA [Alistipes sp.]
MKKNPLRPLFLLLLLPFLLLELPAFADARSTALLTRLSEQVRKMPGYAVSFSVTSGEQLIEGRYVVKGESYYMSFGIAEVFCDGKTRWEVDSSKKEVVMDAVNRTSHNILDNPTHAFDLVDGSFKTTLISETGGVAVVRLIPTSAQAGMTTIVLSINTATATPRSLTYELSGDHVEVTVNSFRASSAMPKIFRATDYPNYEKIDFR